MASDATASGAVFNSGLRARPGLFTCALGGLEASIAGIVWMFGCFIVAAFWNGVGIWSVPNLFSTIFYGDYAFDDAFFKTTWSGLALMIVIYGLLGIAWGCLWKENRKPLLSFFGALTGLFVYYVSFHFVWPTINALISLHAPERELEVAHILWGAALAKSPGYTRRIEAALAPAITPNHPAASCTASSASASAATSSDHDDSESVTGELIQ
jgi:hypothetical protein